jgi:hypothetical protein
VGDGWLVAAATAATVAATTSDDEISADATFDVALPIFRRFGSPPPPPPPTSSTLGSMCFLFSR